MRLAKEGRIILDLDETVEVSHVTVQEADELHFEIDLTGALEASGEYFTRSFFDNVIVYINSCFEFDDNEINEERNVPPKESGDGSIQPKQQQKQKNERTI